MHVQVDRSQFVQRRGAELVLGGRPFRFTGASNYYVLTRAVDPATRAQVPPPPTPLPPRPHLRAHTHTSMRAMVILDLKQ